MSISILPELRDALDAEAERQRRFALALHGAVRATKEVDILIDATVENARLALQALKFGIAAELDDPLEADRSVAGSG